MSRYIERFVAGGIGFLLALNCVAVAPAQQKGADGKNDAAVASTVEFQGEAGAPEEALSLWYRRPAKQWTEALAIGNGRMGGMVFGGVDHERIQLNEDTLWAGGPYDPSNPEALAALPEVRKLVFEGKYVAARNLIGEKMMARPMREMAYETVGDLLLEFPGISSVKNYRRSLNLDTAVASVEFETDGVKYTRQMFASAVDQVIVVRLAADKPGKISFTASMRTPQKATVEASAPGTLLMSGVNGDSDAKNQPQIKGALKFQARVRVKADGGKTEIGSDRITVSGADEATLFIAMGTSYKNYKDVSGDPEATTTKQIAAAEGKRNYALMAEQINDYQQLFERVKLDLGGSKSEATNQPTDERIKNFAKGDDPQFAAIYFQFGRYLLINCSRPGGQPANLQGMWNESMTPPWESKYTININTEMNYWPAESCNLSECVEPLVDMVMDLTHTGAVTAEVNYGARGWVAHHNTDLWRATGPVDRPDSGMWPTGGAWLCLHLWDHYLYSGNKMYLTEDLSRAQRGVAVFLGHAGGGSEHALFGDLPVGVAGAWARWEDVDLCRADDGQADYSRPVHQLRSMRRRLWELMLTCGSNWRRRKSG